MEDLESDTRRHVFRIIKAALPHVPPGATIYVHFAAADASCATGQVYGSSGGAGSP